MTKVWSIWISCFAATVWLLAAMSTTHGLLKKFLFGTLIFANSAILISTRYSNDQMVRGSHSFNLKLYGWTVTVEFVAILVVICAMIKLHRQRFIAAAVVIAVGLHFIGMWAASGIADFITLAVLLTVAGCGALVTGPKIEQLAGVANGSLFLAGLGAAASFWLTAVGILSSMHR